MVDDNGARDRRQERGIVRSWNQEKGFGFIVTSKGGAVFCHAREISDGNMLEPGKRVRFRLRYDRDKREYSAQNLTGGGYARPGG